MKNPIALCILQLIISYVFFVKDSFANVSQACLDEMIKTKEANWNWNEEITPQDVNFRTLIPKEDKTGVTTQSLIENCQGKSGIFARILIPTGDEPSADRIIRESKIQKVLYEVAGFDKNFFNRTYSGTLNLFMSKRRVIYIGEINSSVRQYFADKEDYKNNVKERLQLLYKYIDKEMKNRKKKMMCKEDSIKCLLLGLKKSLDILGGTNILYNHTAKCYENICRIRLTKRVETINFKESYFNYIDEYHGYGNFVTTELKKSETSTLEEGEGTSEETEDAESDDI